MSVPFQARDVVQWCAASLVHGSPETSFRGVSIDSRAVPAGALFVAIRGPRHDGHAFLEAAATAGAAGVLVDSAPAKRNDALAVLVVRDTTTALGALAAGHREGFGGPLVAITGSNGKTTTKEICAAILGVAGPCLKTRGNLNNEYGLPLTLLSREPEQRSAVVEIGMNHRGEIAPLARIARPDVGVITNVGTAHIEHLGSREAIAQEKGDLVAALGPEGTAVLNGDDPLARGQASRTRARVLRFGETGDAEIRGDAVESLGADGFSFTLHTPAGSAPVRVRGLGRPTVSNALAASAAAMAAGASLEDVVLGLGRYEPIGGRMQQRSLPGGATVIDDTYNANPQSMEAALRGLCDLGAETTRVAVIGDMGELGASAADAHHGAGRLAAELGVDHLIALGQHARDVIGGARDAGMAPDRLHTTDSHEAAAARVQQLLGRDGWVLVKGSRSMQMERVVTALMHEGIGDEKSLTRGGTEV